MRLLRSSITSALVAGALILGLAMPAAARSPDQDAATGDGHCVMRLEHISTTGPEAKIVNTQCFATFEEAFEYTARGRMDVSSTLRPQDLTKAMVAEASSLFAVVLGVNYDWQSYGGQSWIWEASSTCTSSTSWYVSNVGTGFGSADNRFESSKAYDGCDVFKHYEHPSYEGSQHHCTPNCTTLSLLNNQVSSLSWHP